MNNQSHAISDAKEFLINYLDTYFVERNLEGILSLLTDNMVGFGTGLDEIAQSTEDFTHLYTRDIEQAPNTIDYTIHKLFATHIDQNVYSVNATLDIKTVIQDQEFAFNHLRLSLILVKKGNDFSISLMHVSLPTIEHEQDESYPIKELEERNQLLHKLVDAKTIELKIALDEINTLACTDKLTGLNNRYVLDDKLTEEIKRAEKYGNNLSLILIDIDYFKKINDTYGHIAGDQFLTEISRIMQYHKRSMDTIGRWGGEEFLIICPEADISQAYALAEKIRSSVEQYNFSLPAKQTISLGVSTYQAKDSYDTLFHRADKAMYKSKANGRNRVTAQ